jgi:hypothetical protein
VRPEGLGLLALRLIHWHSLCTSCGFGPSLYINWPSVHPPSPVTQDLFIISPGGKLGFFGGRR